MRMFNATPYGAVLLDLTMPEMHGFELARRLRMSSSACPPIIAISGWADARTKGQARDAGIDSYIVKPADIDELQRLLAGIGRKDHGSEDAWISPV
jgi:DNA-binding response OmpR family regulator